jgi:hypothetical protein
VNVPKITLRYEWREREALALLVWAVLATVVAIANRRWESLATIAAMARAAACSHSMWAPRTERSHRRTVDSGRAMSTAIRRYPAPRVLASNAVPITAVVSARRGSTDPGNSTWVVPHATQRSRRGRRVSVRRVVVMDLVGAPSPRAAASRRTLGAGQVSSLAVRSASARARSTIAIIGSSSRHTARAWSITSRRDRGQLLLPDHPPEGSTVDRKAGYGAVTVTPPPPTSPQHARRIGTVTAPTNSPGPPRHRHRRWRQPRLHRRPHWRLTLLMIISM